MQMAILDGTQRRIDFIKSTYFLSRYENGFMKKNLLIGCCILSCCRMAQAQNNGDAHSILDQMEKVADWQLKSWEKEGMRKDKSDWTNGACYAGFMALNRVANDPKYLCAMKAIGNSMHWNTGPKKTFADDYCVGQLFAQMYALFHDPEMISGFQAQADSIASLPHEESLEWKNDIQLREWAWCDALFMGPPALAYLSKATGEKKYLDLASRLWWKTTAYLYDSVEHLYFRDGRFLNQKEANGKKMFWSRGNGWVMGGLVRMLENMPPECIDRQKFINLFKVMAATIAAIQHADGSWHAALLDTVSYPVHETSGTGFYCYALAWGINHKLLPYAQYAPVVIRAWNSLVNSVHEDGKLGFVQQIGEKPGAVDGNSTEVYGVGAFLLAGSEMIPLSLLHKENAPILTLYNPTGLERSEEIVSVPCKKLFSFLKITGIKKYRILDPITGIEIPYQWERLGNEAPVNLLVQVNITAGSTVFLEFSDQGPSPLVPKTFARFVPERLDDFAWENDRIAYRMFGKALEGSSGDAYGIDIWVKRTGRLVLNERYKRGEYHIDHGDGMDYYDVGFSLGAGNIAPYLNDSIWYSKNYRHWTILDNGPLRSSFQLEYDNWNVNGDAVRVSKTISLDAGSQLNRIEVRFDYAFDRSLPAVVGIVKRKDPGVEWLDEKKEVMGYWEPANKNNGTTGVGCLFTSPVQQMMIRHGQLLTELEYTPGHPLVYFAGAVWDKAAKIIDAKGWFHYLEDFQFKLNHPLEIAW